MSRGGVTRTDGLCGSDLFRGLLHEAVGAVREHGESEGICKEAVVDYPNRLAEVPDDNQEELQDRIREHF